MKRLLLLLPLLFVAGCGKYGSRLEAGSACSSWEEKKGTFETRDCHYCRLDIEPIRWCLEERETRQILGFEYPNAQADTTYVGEGARNPGTFTNENGRALKPEAISKRFKY